MSLPVVPINSLSRHIDPLRDLLMQAATDVIASGHFVLGPGVTAFEQTFAAYCGSVHGIGVANGTDALELALRALGTGPAHQVAVIANAAMYSTTAVLACGAEPVFVDVDPDTGLLDVAALARVLEANPRVHAVIATHLYGRLADIEAIVLLCRPRGIAIMEDCAQAHGATRSDGARAGALGDIACFSFYPTKNLGALGDGGAIVTASDALAARSRQLRQYGWGSKYRNDAAGGRNSRLDEIQARMLLAMLPQLDDWNARRRAVANFYVDGIRNPRITLPPPSGSESVAHLFVVRSAERDALRQHLLAAGVQTDVHYPLPDHRQPCHAGRFDAIVLPVTERLAREVLTLPCFPELSGTEVERVIDACNRF